MTDNQLKLEVLKLAINITTETVYARRLEVENGWQHRTAEVPFPKLPTLDLGEAVTTYKILMGAMDK